MPRTYTIRDNADCTTCENCGWEMDYGDQVLVRDGLEYCCRECLQEAAAIHWVHETVDLD